MPASVSASVPVDRDPRRLWWWLSAALPLGALLNLMRWLDSGATLWLWAMPAFTYLLLPLLDALLARDQRNLSAPARAALDGAWRYRLLVVAYVPLQLATLALGCWIAVQHGAALSPAAWLGLILTVGGVTGVGINTAHELGHRSVAWERALARLALAPTLYGHFQVEHNRGHHRRVATLDDPASARMGESFWAFLPRVMLGSVRSAWALESRRLAAAGHGAWHWRNYNLQSWSLSVLLLAALVAALGPAVLPFFLVQALYGASLLEVVNYIEHYGLKRAPGPGGAPQRVTPQHSWNSAHAVSNLFLFQLQRHSDHHANPGRRFQLLDHAADAPQLPSGYPGMLLLAYVPPLWFVVMNPRVLAHYGGDIERAQLHPPCAAALRRRHALP
ncbi:MAG: alkane 1-monooxygenase [Aquabacterium sp.]